MNLMPANEARTPACHDTAAHPSSTTCAQSTTHPVTATGAPSATPQAAANQHMISSVLTNVFRADAALNAGCAALYLARPGAMHPVGGSTPVGDWVVRTLGTYFLLGAGCMLGASMSTEPRARRMCARACAAAGIVHILTALPLLAVAEERARAIGAMIADAVVTCAYLPFVTSEREGNA